MVLLIVLRLVGAWSATSQQFCGAFSGPCMSVREQCSLSLSVEPGVPVRRKEAVALHRVTVIGVIMIVTAIIAVAHGQ
jgi:hypothetical protein